MKKNPENIWRKRPYWFSAVLTVVLSVSPVAQARADAAKYRAVIVRAAGPEPGGKKAENVDAVTHATTKAVNTYVCADKLAKQLAKLNVEIKTIDFLDCPGLNCLLAGGKETGGSGVDLVVFAGPAFNGKQPKQMQALFEKLNGLVKASPRVICTSLVPAWYPETTGLNAVKHSHSCFEAAGARAVMGVSIQTPRKDKDGATEEELDKIVSRFASDIAAKLAEQ